MAKIEVQTFFYDLIHCKDKVLSVFNEFDEQYGEDERGSLVAGIQDLEAGKLVNRDGSTLSVSLREALVTDDGKTMYPINDGIPVLLEGESVAMEQVEAS